MDSILTSTAQGPKEMTEKMTRKHYKVDVIVKGPGIFFLPTLKIFEGLPS